jgi:hypothetical protein
MSRRIDRRFWRCRRQQLKRCCARLLLRIQNLGSYAALHVLLNRLLLKCRSAADGGDVHSVRSIGMLLNNLGENLPLIRVR